MTVGELRKKYEYMLTLCCKNQEEIKQREQTSVVEYQNLVAALSASLILLGEVKAIEKDTKLLLKTDNAKFLVPIDDVKKILGERYEKYINPTEVEEETEQETLPKPQETNLPEYMLDTLLAYEDETVNMEREKPVETPTIAPAPEPQPIVEPEPEEKEEYVEDDEADSRPLSNFICNLHKETVVRDGDYDTEVPFVVYPLEYANERVPASILVIIYKRGVIKAAYSEIKKTVTIEYDGYTFFVSGKWKDGKFVSQIIVDEPAKTLSSKVVSIDEGIRPRDFGKRIQCEKDELILFPVSFKNDSSTGTVPMLAFLPNENNKMLTTDNELKMQLSLAGKYVELEGYFANERFYVTQK